MFIIILGPKLVDSFLILFIDSHVNILLLLVIDLEGLDTDLKDQVLILMIGLSFLRDNDALNLNDVSRLSSLDVVIRQH